MNTSNVKKYAPKARKAFIEAMSKQAAKYGITKKKIEPAEQKGDLVLIGDRPFPASVIKPRERLVKRIEQQGFDQVMEHVAYSWFNRLCAIRYMERKGFLDHGRRVLSAADGSAGVPQILEECLDVELPGLDQAKVRELKLDGTKDEELYHELLLAQCHALHQAMPFLFEAVADESELLLPENLTKTDSLIRELVASVPDEDWDDIEIIGWLYQFYISEKKDQVIGKVVKSEDIPAATQLFTPNWIVQYLVQNSVGRQWLQTYPDSPLREKMPYYIEPAEQTPEVQAQLAEITPSEIAPESIKVLDPAAGSGHILVEAYKVLKAIYEERGYRTRDIPQLILENNLFGLDIDDRAGQLAGFALMMLAREDDRRVFSRNIRLNVLSLKESSDVNLPSLWQALNLSGEWQSGTSQRLFEDEQQDLSAFAADNRYQLLQRTLERFKKAKTFGSLIGIPHDDCEELKELFITLRELDSSGDSMQKSAVSQLLPYVHQAVFLAQKYEAVVANPPYMGSKSYNPELKKYVKQKYKSGFPDLYSCFYLKNLDLCNEGGMLSMITIPNWMFLSSFEDLRSEILYKSHIVSLVHNGRGVWGSDFGSCAFVNKKISLDDYRATYIRLFEKQGSVSSNDELNRRFFTSRKYSKPFTALKAIPGNPLSYWLPDEALENYKKSTLLGDHAEFKQGMSTTDSERFVRQWYEVNIQKCAFGFSDAISANEVGKIWFPFNKGGGYRKWYGNQELIVRYENDGRDLLDLVASKYPNISDPEFVIKNRKRYFLEGVTYTSVSSSFFGARYLPPGFIFSVAGPMIFTSNIDYKVLLAFLLSPISVEYVKAINPSLGFQGTDLEKLPYLEKEIHHYESDIKRCVDELISIAKRDWDSMELSWEFNKPRLDDFSSGKIEFAYNVHLGKADSAVRRVIELEIELSKLFSSLYKIDIEHNNFVNEGNVTLFDNPVFIYGRRDEAVNLRDLHKCSLVVESISYSIGCMLGRYSLDRDGLVFANSNNEGFFELVSQGAYKTFPADDDGIIPLTDQEWFPDDATNRFRDFVKVVWGEEHLHENLDFVAESLCLHAIKPKKSESPMDTIRRYLSTQFYKDHLKTYKKRPIYWLFSSGKQKAFECLVYLHRYNEGTLARMRTEYVIPLTAKMAAYAQKLENDKEASGSAAEVKRLEKEIAQLHKQQAELSEFDEKLRHYADRRISLDLDDGVKVNYGKFGDLLAEVKAITGDSPEVLS